ncbi:Histone-Lysine N-Methyltransferase ash1l [Clydaea vesicula]|uniref:Histone-Lysine N-Methyltransferase ash1l n=1 Tax=Clydaea vesicula TaxID=447962 RepID=A0AAD5U5T4_9FUNG|nr:Histone-Lysine N-Methyltransferase ash1l [Clydaea vesicula]
MKKQTKSLKSFFPLNLAFASQDENPCTEDQTVDNDLFLQNSLANLINPPSELIELKRESRRSIVNEKKILEKKNLIPSNNQEKASSTKKKRKTLTSIGVELYNVNNEMIEKKNSFSNSNNFFDSQKKVIISNKATEFDKNIKRFWRIKELQWEKNFNVELKFLYGLKDYLEAGLYSKISRAGHQKTSPLKDEGVKVNDNILPQPLYYGKDHLLNLQRDFVLPEDVMMFAESINRIDRSQMGKRPRPFVLLRQNIFVNRKPRLPKELAICLCPYEEGKEGCVGTECLNRCTFMECDPKLCKYGENCGNQRFQKTEEVEELEVFSTSVRGFGLRTLRDIKQGVLVKEYRGEIIDEDCRLQRMNSLYNGIENYYFLEYSQNEVIDACRKGTEARFVNHSCDPNCHIEKWQVDGEFRIGLFSSKDIKAGSELTYDYKFQAFGQMLKCLCGSDICRGFLGNNKKSEEMKERDELQRRKKKLLQNSEKLRLKPFLKKLKLEKEEEEPVYFWSQRQYTVENLTDNFENCLKYRSYFQDTGLLLVRNFIQSFYKMNPIENKKFLKNFVKEKIERKKKFNGFNLDDKNNNTNNELVECILEKKDNQILSLDKIYSNLLEDKNKRSKLEQDVPTQENEKNNLDDDDVDDIEEKEIMVFDQSLKTDENVLERVPESEIDSDQEMTEDITIDNDITFDDN